MADIILKNQSGEDVTYEGVTDVELKTADGGTQTFSLPTLMNDIYFYIARNENGGLTILNQPIGIVGTNAILHYINSSICEQYGDLIDEVTGYQIWVVASKKQLTIGQTYNANDILNGNV